jgi:hypothetical protein
VLRGVVLEEMQLSLGCMEIVMDAWEAIQIVHVGEDHIKEAIID